MKNVQGVNLGGSWGPGILESGILGSGILGSWDLGSWDLGSWDPGTWDGAGFYSGSWEIHFGTKATCREFHDILLFSWIYPWPEPYIGPFLINIPLAR